MGSGASALRLDTGHTLGPFCAQDLGLADPAPAWLAGRPGGRSCWLKWLTVWLNG